MNRNPVIRLFRSLKLTIALIICLAVVFLLGVMVPQKDLLGKDLYLRWQAEKPGLVSFLEFLGLTDIYIAPITLALWVVFFLNLIMVMSKRIPSIWRRCAGREVPAGVDAVKAGMNYETIEGGSLGDVEAALKGRGYKIFSEGGAFRAIRNRLSPLATLFFHLSFLLLLVGGVTSFYTKFRAEAHVAEGETFIGEYDRVARPKIGGIPRASVRIESIEPSYYKGVVPVDLKVVLGTEEGRKVIGINRPYKKGWLSFVIKDLDVAPRFVIKDEEGNEVDASYFKLKVLKGGEGAFSMSGYDFRTFFYTDYREGFKREDVDVIQELSKAPMTLRSQQKEIVNPAFYVAVFKDGKLLTTKTIAMNEPMEFDGMRLYFTDIIYWLRFLAVKEHGLGIVYTGFALIVIALIIRFVFYRRDIMGIFDGGKLHISGRSEHFPSLFEDEFSAITDRIKGGGN